MLGMGPSGMILVGLICSDDKLDRYADVQNVSADGDGITHKRMGPVIVSLDMIKVGRGPECIVIPVEFLHPTEDTMNITIR
jgi:hypothetical protein